MAVRKHSPLTRTLASLSDGGLVTPYLEEKLLGGSLPAEYNIHIKEYDHKWNDRFHPSTDIGASEKALYTKLHPVTGPTLTREKFTASSLFAMGLGTAMHAILEAVFIDIGFCKKEDTEVYFHDSKGLNISGLCDIRRITLPDGKELLADIKTCSRIPSSPDPHHKLQVLMYMDLVPDAPRTLGDIIYFEKSSPHRVRDFVVERDDAALAEVYESWARVRHALAIEQPGILLS